MTPNFELLKDAYAIIAGIPEEQFDLDMVFKNRGGSNGCGTIACAIGWLSLHPKFIELGLRQSYCGVSLHSAPYFYDDAAKVIFSISIHQARAIFGREGISWYDHPDMTKALPNNHKALFLHRVESFLKEHGEWKGFQE